MPPGNPRGLCGCQVAGAEFPAASAQRNLLLSAIFPRKLQTVTPRPSLPGTTQPTTLSRSSSFSGFIVFPPLSPFQWVSQSSHTRKEVRYKSELGPKPHLKPWVVTCRGILCIQELQGQTFIWVISTRVSPISLFSKPCILTVSFSLSYLRLEHSVTWNVQPWHRKVLKQSSMKQSSPFLTQRRRKNTAWSAMAAAQLYEVTWEAKQDNANVQLNHAG